AGHRPGPHEPSPAPAARRAQPGARAPDHRAHLPHAAGGERGGGLHPAGGAERPPGAGVGPLRLRAGDRLHRAAGAGPGAAGEPRHPQGLPRRGMRQVCSAALVAGRRGGWVARRRADTSRDLSRMEPSAVTSRAMHALKSSLLLLASLAIVGCPSTPVTPEPEPEPEPEQPEPEVRGPCDTDGDALRDGSRVIRWARSGPQESVLSPDAEGRVGAVVLFEAGQDRTRALRERGYVVTGELPLVNGATVRGT